MEDKKSKDKSSTLKSGELAKMFGVTARTIRYYEELGLLDAEHRDTKEHRRYLERNAVRLKRIQQLKDYGLSLSEIQELFELAKKDRTSDAVRNALKGKYKEKLIEAEAKKKAICDYIEDLSWHIEQLEKVADFFSCPGKACTNCTYRNRCDIIES